MASRHYRAVCLAYQYRQFTDLRSYTTLKKGRRTAKKELLDDAQLRMIAENSQGELQRRCAELELKNRRLEFNAQASEIALEKLREQIRGLREESVEIQRTRDGVEEVTQGQLHEIESLKLELKQSQLTIKTMGARLQQQEARFKKT